MNKTISTTLFFALAVLTAGHSVLGQAEMPRESIYLSDTGQTNDGRNILFRVYLNTVTGRAELTPLDDVGYGPGAIPFDTVIALACAPDGTKLFCIESEASSPFHRHLGVYDLEQPAFDILGLMQGMDFPTAQAAFSEDGELYFGNQQRDALWTVDIDPDSPTYLCVSEVGVIKTENTLGVPDVRGADVVSDAQGTFYLWTNRAAPDAPAGLYRLTIPPDSGWISAEHLGLNEGMFTGLAIRANGFGDLIGSITSPSDSILVIDKENAGIITSYPMYLDGLPYAYRFGDMTVGSLSLCTKTIGFWKNHGWDETGITICGVLLQEWEGKSILRNARGNNYSMLFAQLIAAKLNTNNSTGIPEIEAAESYICSTWGPEWLGHIYDPIPKTEKKTVVALWKVLDAFNNLYPCS